MGRSWAKSHMLQQFVSDCQDTHVHVLLYIKVDLPDLVVVDSYAAW